MEISSPFASIYTYGGQQSLGICLPSQGQARGYGRITHFLPPPTWGHDFPWAIVTRLVGIFQTPACHMKDMEILFAKIPFA